MPTRINQKYVYAHCQDLRYCSIQCRLSSLCIFKCSNIREALPRHQYIAVFEHCSKGGRDLKSLSKNVQPKYSKRRGRWVNGILINLKKNALLVGVTSLINWCTYFATLYFKTGYLLHTLPLKTGPANFFTMKMAMESIPLIHDSSLLRTNNYSTTWILGILGFL